MANLKPLIRLRKFEVEEKQKILVALLREVEKLESKKTSILISIKAERKIAEDSDDYETQAAYRMYAERARQQVDLLNAEIGKYDFLIKRAQDDMRDAFAEQKKIEIIQENRDAEEEAAIAAKDAATMDEIGLNGFVRKDGN
jgi:flagellar export protein FliJ